MARTKKAPREESPWIDEAVWEVTQVENPMADDYRRELYTLHDEIFQLPRHKEATETRIVKLEKLMVDPEALSSELKPARKALSEAKTLLIKQTNRLDYLKERIAHLESFPGLLPNTGGRRKRCRRHLYTRRCKRIPHRI